MLNYAQLIIVRIRVTFRNADGDRTVNHRVGTRADGSRLF